MNEDLENRLYNYKFNQALQYLDGESEEVIELVTVLARVFDDFCGGDMCLIVTHALQNIDVKFED